MIPILLGTLYLAFVTVTDDQLVAKKMTVVKNILRTYKLNPLNSIRSNQQSGGYVSGSLKSTPLNVHV